MLFIVLMNIINKLLNERSVFIFSLTDNIVMYLHYIGLTLPRTDVTGHTAVTTQR
jgi:hypothetical protein